MTQVLTPVADRLGTYRLIMGAAVFKLAAGVLMFIVGRRAWPLWALLFLGNRLAATVWGFYNLSFSDVSVGVRWEAILDCLASSLAQEIYLPKTMVM